MMAQKPLMLKDYLELDSESSSSSGFRCAPRRTDTVRCLLEAELRRAGGDDRRQNARSARSKSAALTKLSAVISAVKLLPFSSSSSSPGGGDGHSGGFSRRLIRGGFWKPKKARRREEPEKVRVLDVVLLPSYEEEDNDLRSFVFPSPVVSSCSSSSSSETTTASSSPSDFLPSFVSSSENLDAIAAVAVEFKKDSSPPSTPKPADAVAGRHRPPPKQIEAKDMASSKCHLEEEEKEQLSPVSVMEFPYEPEDEDDSEDEISSIASPPFSQNLANIERTKLQLLQKIRRFESLAELDAVDLEERFEDISTSGDEHETASDYESDVIHVVSSTGDTRAWALLEELRRGPHFLGSFEKLLLDFFVHGLRRFDEEHVNLSRPSGRSKGAETSRGAQQREESMLRAARDWMRGDVEERRGDATIKEMEGNGRWRCHAEEEDELGAHLEGYVFGSLLDELVSDLGSR